MKGIPINNMSDISVGSRIRHYVGGDEKEWSDGICTIVNEGHCALNITRSSVAFKKRYVGSVEAGKDECSTVEHVRLMSKKKAIMQAMKR